MFPRDNFSKTSHWRNIQTKDAKYEDWEYWRDVKWSNIINVVLKKTICVKCALKFIYQVNRSIFSTWFPPETKEYISTEDISVEDISEEEISVEDISVEDTSVEDFHSLFTVLMY